MPKANVTLGNGTKVTIEGSTDEVAALVNLISSGDSESPTDRRPERTRQWARKPAHDRVDRARKKGPVDYVRELIAEDFFASKRGLGDVQRRLEEAAHIYAITTLSPAMFRLVRAKELRRVKESGVWKYVNP